MNYKCNKKVFTTLEEANAYANAIMRATGEVLIVTTTKQAVTHTYTSETIEQHKKRLKKFQKSIDKQS